MTVSYRAGGHVGFFMSFVNFGFIIYFEARFSVLEVILSSWCIELFDIMKCPLFIINSALALNFTLSDGNGAAPPVLLVSTAAFHFSPFCIFLWVRHSS